MIDIVNFTISNDGSSLRVEVATDTGEIITSAIVWTDKTFKDYNQYIDVTSYLNNTTNEEYFVIPASVLGESSLNGIYFIEFQTSSTVEEECTNCNNSLGVAASLFHLKECLLSKVREYSVCSDYLNSKCDGPLVCNIINIHILLKSLTTSLEFGYYEDALDFLKTLNKLCNDCNCKDLPSPTFKSGLDYGTLDNSLILV